MTFLPHQRGLSLLELSLALTLGATLVVWQFWEQSEALKEQHLSSESAWIAGVSSDLQKELGSTSSYAGVSNLTLGTLRSIPSAYLRLLVGATQVGNGFGGQLQLAPLSLKPGSSNDAIVLRYSKVPKSSCTKLVLFLDRQHQVRGVPLTGIVGDSNSADAMPAGLNSIVMVGGNLTVAAGSALGTHLTVLKSSADAGLNMTALAAFCGNAVATEGALMLIRQRI